MCRGSRFRSSFVDGLWWVMSPKTSNIQEKCLKHGLINGLAAQKRPRGNMFGTWTSRVVGRPGQHPYVPFVWLRQTIRNCGIISAAQDIPRSPLVPGVSSSLASRSHDPPRCEGQEPVKMAVLWWLSGCVGFLDRARFLPQLALLQLLHPLFPFKTKLLRAWKLLTLSPMFRLSTSMTWVEPFRFLGRVCSRATSLTRQFFWTVPGSKKKQENLPQKRSGTLQHHKHWRLTTSFIKVNFGRLRHHIAFNKAQHGGWRCQASVGPEDRDMGSLVIGSGAFQNSSLARNFMLDALLKVLFIKWSSSPLSTECSFKLLQGFLRTDATRCYTMSAKSRSTSPSPLMPLRRLRLWDPQKTLVEHVEHIWLGPGDYGTMLTMLTIFAILGYVGICWDAKSPSILGFTMALSTCCQGSGLEHYRSLVVGSKALAFQNSSLVQNAFKLPRTG